MARRGRRSRLSWSAFHRSRGACPRDRIAGIGRFLLRHTVHRHGTLVLNLQGDAKIVERHDRIGQRAPGTEAWSAVDRSEGCTDPGIPTDRQDRTDRNPEETPRRYASALGSSGNSRRLAQNLPIGGILQRHFAIDAALEILRAQPEALGPERPEGLEPVIGEDIAAAALERPVLPGLRQQERGRILGMARPGDLANLLEDQLAVGGDFLVFEVEDDVVLLRFFAVALGRRRPAIRTAGDTPRPTPARCSRAGTRDSNAGAPTPRVPGIRPRSGPPPAPRPSAGSSRRPPLSGSRG